MSIRVVFDIEGCTKDQAERWGESIVDACHLDPKLAVLLEEVEDTERPDSREVVIEWKAYGEQLRDTEQEHER